MGYTFLAKISILDSTFPKPTPTPPGKPPSQADDPWYGIDLGLGYLRPTHPIAPGGKPPPVDPAYGIDAGLGVLHPEHPIVLPPDPITPPPPVDPAFGIDEILGWLKPTHPIILPPDPPPAEKPAWKVTAAWTPLTGWIVVGIPTGEHPTPSKRK